MSRTLETVSSFGDVHAGPSVLLPRAWSCRAAASQRMPQLLKKKSAVLFTMSLPPYRRGGLLLPCDSL